jgi:lysyl-tRNA synthetase class II
VLMRATLRCASIAGRVMAKRASGAKLFFYTIVSNGVKVQVMADARCAHTHDGCLLRACLQLHSTA